VKTILRILRYLLPYKRNLILASASMFFFVLFNMSTVLLVVPFINVLFEKGGWQMRPMPPFSFDTLKEWAQIGLGNLMASTQPATAVKVLCVLIILAFLFKNVFYYLQGWFMAPAEQGIIRDIRQSLFEHLTGLSMSFFTEGRKGAIISRIINDVQLVNDSAIAVVNSMFRDPPQIITYLVILFVIDWKLTLLVLILLPLTGVLLARLADYLRKESHILQDTLSEITSVLDEGLANMRIIKAFGTEAHEIRRFSIFNQRIYRTFVNIVRKRDLSSPITETASVLVAVLILWFLGQAVLTGESGMTSGVFVAYIFSMLQLMQPLKFFGQMISSISRGLAGAQRVFEILDVHPRIVDAPDAVVVRGFRDRIAFEDVRFRYDTGDDILCGLSAEIHAGEVVAIVGPSGVGKSTMVDLVPRFYDVTGGAITLDGVDVRRISIASLRGMMGVVTQETFLFNTSIRENIAYGLPDASEAAIIEAARAANAHDFILETPAGYDTTIGDRGVRLSGGQRQRLAIARAILRNPPILILDEATSALDTESEQLVQQAIEHLMEGRTSIVIAHRLSTIQRADRIYVLEAGRVVETGRHEELIRNASGLYKRLYDLQFRA
jgi:ATP-binding cassette, subfamily B, bacterial MsbA